jgi:hypothetical protein
LRRHYTPSEESRSGSQDAHGREYEAGEEVKAEAVDRWRMAGAGEWQSLENGRPGEWQSLKNGSRWRIAVGWRLNVWLAMFAWKIGIISLL